MTSTDTAATAQAATDAKEIQHTAKKLYETQIEQFRKLAGEDLEAAFNRYGFTLFHSLPGEEQVLVAEKMGVKCQVGADYYNLGVAHASKEDYDKAIAAWTQALKMDSTLTDAIFNIALASEKTNNLSAARANYKKYIESIENAEEIESVKQHLAEIGG